MLCFSIKLESEAEPQLFLACSQFLGKFEPRCSYKIVLIKIKRVVVHVQFKFLWAPLFKARLVLTWALQVLLRVNPGSSVIFCSFMHKKQVIQTRPCVKMKTKSLTTVNSRVELFVSSLDSYSFLVWIGN